MVRIKSDADWIDLRRCRNDLASSIGNATEPSRIFFLCDVSGKRFSLSREIIWTEATHDPVCMADGVLTFDKAIHTIKAVPPPTIPCAVQLLELYHQMRSAGRTQYHSNVRTRDTTYFTICSSSKLPSFRLEVAINATRSSPIGIFKSFAKVVSECSLVLVERDRRYEILM